MRFGWVAVCGVLALAGCGDDDEDGGGGEAAKPATLNAAVTGTDKPALEVPASIEAGVVTLRLTNSFGAPVDTSVIRVDGEQTAADVLKIVDSDEDGAPIPAWLHGAGGLPPVEPKGTEASTQILQPGRYFVVANAEVEGDKQPPAATAELEVTGELPDDAALPAAAGGTITASEYTFKTSGLKAGKNTVRFENTGRELHHALAFPIRGDATIKEIAKLFASDEEPSGPPPVDFESGAGTAVIDGGAAQNVDLELKAGRYALVCFIPDRAGGPPHAAKGMITELTVPS